MPERRSKTADAKLQAKIEHVASLSIRERILLALQLGEEIRALQGKVRRA